MKILEIYSRYAIPPMLQEHMLRVAAVGNFICDNFTKPEIIDKKLITEVLLLHDMGNIIKFDLQNPLKAWGEELKRIEYWKEVQRSFKEKYNNDEHTATIAIAHELGMPQNVQDAIKKMGSSYLALAAESNDWNQKIYCYSDTRIAPYGVVTVNKRWDDVIERYKGRTHALGDVEEVERRRTFCLQVEKQIQKYLPSDLDSLTDSSITPYLTTLRSYDMPTTMLT